MGRRWATRARPGKALATARHPRPGQRVGFAWYRKEQWALLRELDADPDALDDTYEEWLASATRTMATLRSRGVLVQRVPIDVEAVANWCARQARPFNGAGRAAFVAELLQAASRG